MLCLYRSQHDNQSWLGALVSIMDACALVITTVQAEDAGAAVRQAQLTFAMARHALIDLGHVFHIQENRSLMEDEPEERLSPESFNRLCDALGEMHVHLCGDPATMQRLTAIRQLYEPHAQALADYLRMPLPLWIAEPKPDAVRSPWSRVHELRRGHTVPKLTEEEALRTIQHISESALALDLHSEEHGFHEQVR